MSDLKDDIMKATMDAERIKEARKIQ